MGQFSMEIMPLPGSLLSGNQHLSRTFTTQSAHVRFVVREEAERICEN